MPPISPPIPPIIPPIPPIPPAMSPIPPIPPIPPAMSPMPPIPPAMSPMPPMPPAIFPLPAAALLFLGGRPLPGILLSTGASFSSSGLASATSSSSAGACPVSGISGCRRMSLISRSITGGQLSEMYSLRCVSSTISVAAPNHRSAARLCSRVLRRYSQLYSPSDCCKSSVMSTRSTVMKM